MRIVFFGSDDFSNSILTTLIENDFKPVLVLTAPDKPRGRGKKLLPTEVKVTATSNDIPVFTPDRISPDVIEKIANFNPDVFITISYGLFLPTKLLKLVEYPLNIHPSLLPKFRGASPIRSVLLSGESETGVTIMKMIKKMDAGDIYQQESFKILPSDDYISLKEKLIQLSKKMIIDLLFSIKSGEKPILQPQKGEPTFCSKFTKEDLKINWNEPSASIFNKVRAFSDIGTFTSLNGQRVKIFSVKKSNYSLEPSFIKIEKKSLFVGTADQALELLKLQFPGKKPIKAVDAINGGKFKDVKAFDND